MIPNEKIKSIYLIAICGTGMASLAGLLQKSGYQVTGSDSNIYPPMSTLLQSSGIDIKSGYQRKNITQNIDQALHMARSLPCGKVSVNGFSEGDIKTPFSGYKQSGSLSRDQGTEALNQYLQTKTIWISHS